MEGGLQAEDQLDYMYSILSNPDDPSNAFNPELLARICDNIKENGVRRLNLKGSGLKHRISDKEVSQLVEGLIAANIQLEEVSLPFHRITDAGLDQLTKLMNPATFPDAGEYGLRPLTHLNLEGNDIKGETLFSGIFLSPYDCPLKSFNLGNNPLSSTGHEGISEIVARNRSLYHLSVNSCGFDLKGLISLCAKLRETQTLESLALDRPILTTIRQGEILEQLSKFLETNRSLRSLSLKYHDALDHDVRLISAALYSNHSITQLNLECNKIGVSGAEALASNLLYKGSNSLQYLGLAYNFVSDDGAIALAEAIKANTGLKVLTLRNNDIGPMGLTALADALESASNLETLSIFGNKFDNGNGIHYHRLIKHRLPYVHIFLDIDVYVVDGQYMIAEVPFR